MFSGNYPFHDIKNDFQVIFAVKHGRRPSRPSHDLCQTRGLNDKVWELIKTCWATEPSERPSAGQIVEQLRALPSRPVDDRPLDNFNNLFPSQVLHEANNPFSPLAARVEDTDDIVTW
jgi:hypothetical protein